MFGASFLDSWNKLASYMGRNTGEPEGHEVDVQRPEAPNQRSIDRKGLDADIDGNYLETGDNRGMTNLKNKPINNDVGPTASDVLRRDVAGSHSGAQGD